MGNSISEEEQYMKNKKINEINDFDCPILDIGTKVGFSDYIDFIVPKDLELNDIMKGIDIYKRKFIVIKTEYEFSDGVKSKSFSTFFQRYPNANSWQCCGHYGPNVMNTNGGMNLAQFEFLNQLLINKQLELNEDIINTCSLIVGNGYTDSKQKPTLIRIGWSN